MGCNLSRFAPYDEREAQRNVLSCCCFCCHGIHRTLEHQQSLLEKYWSEFHPIITKNNSLLHDGVDSEWNVSDTKRRKLHSHGARSPQRAQAGPFKGTGKDPRPEPSCVCRFCSPACRNVGVCSVELVQARARQPEPPSINTTTQQKRAGSRVGHAHLSIFSMKLGQNVNGLT